LDRHRRPIKTAAETPLNRPNVPGSGTVEDVGVPWDMFNEMY
jgi:hypothetical protein